MMYSVRISLVMAFGFCIAAGCAPSVNPKSPLRLPSNHRPLFSIEWPGTPNESAELIVIDGLQRKSYSAMLKLNTVNNYLLFAASDIEDFSQIEETQTPEWLLNRSKQLDQFGDEVEFTDRVFDGFPGYFVTKKFSGLNRYHRGITVVVNGHLIGVSVNVPAKEQLDAPEINAFFDSFRVTPEPQLNSPK